MFGAELAYHFFYKLRIFCVHYSYPFSSVSISEPDNIMVLCNREHLLEYDGWGSIVKHDIKNMPDTIDLCQFVEPLLVSITTLELMMFFYYTEEITNANKTIAQLKEKYAVNVSIIFSEDEYGNRSLHPLPISQVIDCMKELENNLYVTINYIENAEDVKFTAVPNVFEKRK